MSRITGGGTFAAGLLRRSAAPFALGFVLLFTQPGGHAQAGDALKFFKNYFVTGDYVVAGVGLRGKGVLDPVSGQMLATDTLNVTGVPTNAEIVAAFLYWQVVSTSTLGPDSGAVNAAFDGSPLSSAGAPLSLVLNSNGTAPCWSSGGGTGSSGGNKLTYTYRVDVRRFLAVDPTTRRLLVNGPHVVRVPDAGSNGNGVPVALGASLVVVYRDPTMPLKAVVLFDGGYTMNQTTDSMSQTIRGFYQASTNAAKLTHIVGSGQANKSENLRFNNSLIAVSPFTAHEGESWDNYTANVTLSSLTESPAPTTSVDHVGFGSFDCLTWGAIILSTEVQDSDGDGLLDIWESSTTPISDPNGQPLPNVRAMVGADHTNVKDVFVQIDYMANGAGNYGGVAKPAHNHLPDPTALKMVGDAFASKGISVHFDVGSNYQSNEAGVGPYIIPAGPAGLARGGKSIDENVTLLGCPGPTCEFPGYPGTVGWKVGFKYYRDQLVSATPPGLDAGNDPCDVPSATPGASNYDGPGGPCERRFDRNRLDMFRYVLGAHALGLGKSEFPCLDPSTGQPTGAGSDGLCVGGTANNNPDFQIPRTSSGVGDFPGADLMLTLGGFSDIAGRPVGTPFMQGSTLMHELGHIFDLGHSGVYVPGVPAEPNCKPNYLSSMNYLFQLRGLFNDSLPLGTPRLDYSNEVLGPIDEVLLTDDPLDGAPSYHTGWYAPKSIFTTGTPATKHCDGTPLSPDEAATLAAGGGMVRVDGPSAISLSSPWTSRSIDWNPDPDPMPVTPPQDVNFDGFAARLTDPPDAFGVVRALHEGSNDWENLRLNQLATRRNVLGLSLDLGRDGLGRGDRLGRDGLGRDGLGRDGLGRDGLGRDGLGRDGLGRDGLGRDGLGRDGLGRDGLGIAGLGRDGLGLEEVDTAIAHASGHAPPNTFSACQIGTAFCPAPGPSLPFHRIIATWNATDVDPDLVVNYSVYRFKTSDGLSTATLVGSVPGPASVPTPPVTATYSLVDTQELPNGSFTYYAIAVFTGDAPGPSSPSNPLITIPVINDPPSGVADYSYGIAQGATLNISAPGVLNNVGDDDSAVLTLTNTQPSHGTLGLSANGSFTYTPTSSFVGVDTFTYTVDDVDPSNARSGTVSITVTDRTPPVVTLTIPSPTGSNGFFKTSPVAVTVSVTDPSNVAAIACTDSITGGSVLSIPSGLNTPAAAATLSVTAEGTHNLSCTATDGVGNNGAAPGSANTGTVKIDTVAPSVTITAPINNATPILKSSVASSFSCSDGTVPPASGLASCVGTVANGANINTAAVGPKTFTVTATDVAGNSTTVTNNYTVIYAMTPPSPSLKSPANQGSAVPINWALKDALGNSINSLTTLLKMESVFNGVVPAGGCVASPNGARETLYSPATGATGGSNFRLVSGGYQFNWDTTTTTTLPIQTGKGCYTVLIYLDERPDLTNPRMTTPVQLK